jgi:O-antigen ligase
VTAPSARFAPFLGRVETVALVLLISAGLFETELVHVGPLTLSSTEVVLAAFVFAVAAARARDLSAVRLGGWVTVALLALTASAALSAVFCDHYRALAWKSAARSLLSALLYVALANALATAGRRRLAFRVLGGTVAAIAAVAIIEPYRYRWVEPIVAPFRSNLFVGVPPPAFFSSGVILDGDGFVIRSSAVFLHANMLGYVLAITAFLFVSAVPPGARARTWALVAGTLALLAAALVLTYSRGAFLAAAVPGVLLVGALVARSARLRAVLWRRRRAAIAGLLVAAVAVLSNRVFVHGIGSLVRPSVAHVTGDRAAPLPAPFDARGSAMTSRTTLWRAALRMARERPLVGIGPDNFRMRYFDYVDRMDQDLATNLGIHRAHNLPLNVLAEQGAIGLAALLVLVAAVVADLRRGLRRAGRTTEALALAAALAAVAIGDLVDTLFYFHVYMILVLALLAAWNALARGEA